MAQTCAARRPKKVCSHAAPPEGSPLFFRALFWRQKNKNGSSSGRIRSAEAGAALLSHRCRFIWRQPTPLIMAVLARCRWLQAWRHQAEGCVVSRACLERSFYFYFYLFMFIFPKPLKPSPKKMNHWFMETCQRRRRRSDGRHLSHPSRPLQRSKLQSGSGRGGGRGS